MKLLTALLVLSTSLLLACSRSDNDATNLAEGQKQAMDKAKAVEDQLQEAAEQRAEQIEQ